MKNVIATLLLTISLSTTAQNITDISTIDFVQILEGRTEQAYHYYENNWTLLREEALKNGIISGYQWIETQYTDEAPFHFIFITTYPDQKTFDKREENFAVIMKDRTRNLLDTLQPKDFRKSVFTKEESKVLERPNQ